MSGSASQAPATRLEALGAELARLDGRSYKAYKAVRGEYDAADFRLLIDHVQGDPFADPSRLRAIVSAAAARLPGWATSTPTRRTATADFLNRQLARELGRHAGGTGSGRSGELRILRPGQQVMVRSSMTVREDGVVEARFRAGLPARGRRILGREAAALLTGAVPAAVRASLFFPAVDEAALRHHLEAVEDSRALRAQLIDAGLVAFVADGALLPRASGIDDAPLEAARAVAFRAPPELRVTLAAPNAGKVAGMGLPAGITLITGGGFHGKSTLLRALERGIYDHIPGDGREQVVTVPDAVKIRAEDGRSVAGTDISNFISGLPNGQDTTHFDTANASGSTSQAAAIIEALEAGARCLLLDEDTSATNFMIRDARMQALVANEFEPITPFIDRVRQLSDEQHVSTILVAGGSGDYFDVADTVVAMRGYLPVAVSAEAKRIAIEHPSERRCEGGEWHEISPRVPLPASIDASRGRRDIDVKVFGARRLRFGGEEVDLSAIEQLVEPAQTRAISLAIATQRGSAIDGDRTIGQAVREISDRLAVTGLDAFQQHPAGELAEFRVAELAAVLNRLRGLRTRAG